LDTTLSLTTLETIQWQVAGRISWLAPLQVLLCYVFLPFLLSLTHQHFLVMFLSWVF